MLVLGLILALAIGLSLGLLGGGGSILTVPVLHYVLLVETHDSIAMSLVIVGVTSAVALVPHARRGCVKWRLGLGFGGASMLGAYAGGRIGALLPGGVLIAAFALLMLVAGTAMLVRARTAIHACTSDDVRLERMLAIGLGVGLVTGVLGAGGGFVIVPVLVLLGGLAIYEAVGTSLLVIAMNSAAALGGVVAAHTSIDLRIVAAVTAIAVGGSLVGVRVGRKLSAQHLQRAFGWFVIAVGVAMLARELI